MKVLKRRLQINKIKGILSLEYRYQSLILKYAIKKIIGLQPSVQDLDFYRFFNYLIQFNGEIIEINSQYFIGKFKTLSNSNIKLRRMPSSDLDVFHQVFFWREYFEATNAYKSYFGYSAGKQYNIIDAGCNIGLTSLFFMENFGNINIICLEPDKENYNILNYNLSKIENHRIIKLNAAIWHTNTKMEIVNDFRDKLDWAKRVREIDGQFGINAFSINQLLEDFGWNIIDILKIDIEGSEKELFTSEGTDLNFLKYTRCVAIEIHDEFNCREEINDIFKQFGFEYFRRGELTIAINKNLLHQTN